MKISSGRWWPFLLWTHVATSLAIVVNTSVLAGSVFAATVPSGFTDALVASGLTWPTALAVANDGRVFVTEQRGTVRVIKNGTLLSTPFVKLTVKSQGGSNEEGLLGITLDPSFATNNFLYVYYTVPASGNVTSHNRVSRFTANGDVAVPGSERVLFEVPGPSSGSHNAGAIHFGADGNLYIAVGDHSVGGNGQSMNTLKGKLLRINVGWDDPSRQPVLRDGNGPESRDLGIGPSQSLQVRRAAGHGQDPHQRCRERLLGRDQRGRRRAGTTAGI